MDAIIFAAGHGTRLRPLTDTLPKPLIEIQGISLIEIHMHRLAAAGFEQVVINLHHLGDQIKSRLGDGRRYRLNIRYSEEREEALETAGGIVRALPLINSNRFAAISADVLCDYPLHKLKEQRLSDADGLLVMVNNPAHHPDGDFALKRTGHLDFKTGDQAPAACTFSGIACFNRSLFTSLAPGKRALRPVLETSIKQGKLRGELHTGLWSDIGNLERLEQARQSSAAKGYISSIKASRS